MFPHGVSTRFRIAVMSGLCSAAAMALVTGPDARAQEPDPDAHQDASAAVDDVPPSQATSGEAPTAGTASDEAPSASDASGAPAPAAKLPEEHRKALALVAEGNTLAEEFLLADAVKKYREALTYWEHPVIHYNLGRLLNALDRPVEAYWSLELALRLGPAALADDPAQAQQLHARLRALRDEIRARLVEIRITSVDRDVEVSIDDRVVTTARPEMFLPGPHRLAAQAPDRRPLLRTMALDAGATLHMGVTSRRSLAAWKPWALTGTGAAVALAGLGLYWHGRNQRDALAGVVKERCQPMCSVEARAGFDRDWKRARTLQGVGIGTLITGGSATLFGIGLVVWNQARELRLRDIDMDIDISIDDYPVSILPIVSPDMTGLVGTTTF